jgi:hypothetical protein
MAQLVATEWLTTANELAKNGAFALYAVGATIALRELWRDNKAIREQNEAKVKAMQDRYDALQQSRIADNRALQDERVADLKQNFQQLLENNDTVVTALNGSSEALTNQTVPAELVRDAVAKLAQESRGLAEAVRAKMGVR